MVHKVAKSRTQLKLLRTHTHTELLYNVALGSANTVNNKMSQL